MLVLLLFRKLKYFGGADAELVFEALGEIAGGGEANLVGYFRDRLMA